MRLGAGSIWRDVYELLESEDLTVTGGQLAPIGVSGLLAGSMLTTCLH